MFKIQLQKTLIYFLILTIVASGFAYRIIVKAYDVAYDDSYN